MIFFTLVEAAEFKFKISTVLRAGGYSGEPDVAWK